MKKTVEVNLFIPDDVDYIDYSKDLLLNGYKRQELVKCCKTCKHGSNCVLNDICICHKTPCNDETDPNGICDLYEEG